MADKKKKIVPKGSQKPNYQVWIIVTLLIVIFGVTYLNKSSSTITITPHRFEEMMLGNDIQKVVLIRNQKYVEITLKPEALQNAKYRTEIENNRSFGVSNGPHYRLDIPDITVFNEDFRAIQNKMEEVEGLITHQRIKMILLNGFSIGGS